MINTSPTFVPGDPIATLRSCNGYYECPKRPDGQRLGPLVGYAGTYGHDLHYVGDVYMNVARIEQHPRILRQTAAELADMLPPCDWVMGVPEGGKSVAIFLAHNLKTTFIYPEKEVLRIGTATQRGESRFVMNRHEIPPRSRGILVEDVTNNFSSTKEIIDLVEAHNAEVISIACLYNRSAQELFEHGRSYPVRSLVQIPTAQYRQDDEAVKDDIAAGNVVWKPKSDWLRLMTMVENAEQRAHGVETGS